MMKLRKFLGVSVVATVIVTLTVTLTFTLAATGPLARSAWAQEPGAADGGVVIEEIIVTAQKRAQNIQDVPVSITTLGGEKLNAITSGGMDIRFLSARVPSLLVESSFGRTFPRFYIRGLGNTDFDLNSSQPVSLIYDEVVLENPIMKGFPAFDLERIEVLRGPQGTLFGRNTPAGIVKFDSKKPTDEFDAYGRISYGRFNGVDFEGAVSGPISGVLSARASVLYQRRDDYVDNTFTGQKNALEGYAEFAGRLQFLFEPNDEFSALVNIHVRDLSGTARVFRANIIQKGSNKFVPGFKRGNVAIDGQNSQNVNEFGLVGKLEYDFGPVTATSVTSFENVQIFSRGDVDGGFGAVFAPPSGPGLIPFTSETADAIPDLEQVTEEIRFATNELGRFDIQGGFFFFSESLVIESFSFATLFGGGQDGFARQSQKTRAYALFASADFDVSDRISLTAGLRFSDDKKDFVAERTLSPLSFLGVVPLAPTTVGTDDSQLSWDFSATYEASDDVNLYTRVAKSFRAPSIQGRVLFAFDLGFGGPGLPPGISVADTETIVSGEVGFKAELYDRRLRLNGSAFYYSVNNQQLTAVGGEFNVNTLLNADQTVGFGFELDLEAAVTEDLLVTAGLSYNNTEIQDKNLAIAPCGGGCTVLDPAGPVAGTVLIDGNSLPQAPRWILNFTARYGVPVGASGEFYIYTDAAYRSKVSFFLYESAEFNDDTLIEVGVRAGYVFNDGEFELAVFGRNIFNNTSLTGGIDFNNLTGFVNEPTIWGLELGARF